MLYTNHDMAAFYAKRPVILNGINDLATRGDLADRAIVVHLERIDPRSARSEEEIWAVAEAARPGIFAALLKIIAEVLERGGNSPRSVEGLPRMVDFAKFGMAAAPSLGWAEADFLRTYSENRRTANDIVIEDDPVAMSILRLVRESPNRQWSGTTAELFDALQASVPNWQRDASAPKSAAALGKMLVRLRPALEMRELAVDLARSNKGTNITLRLPMPVRAAA